MTAPDGVEGWYCGYGLRLALRADTEALLRRATARLPPGFRRAVRGTADEALAIHRQPGGLVLRRRRRVVMRGAARPVLERLGDELERWVALAAHDRIFVHAAVVGWRGRAIVLPGRSGAGKSTLATALVRLGAIYYSDEFAVLDARGQVHPFARAIALRRPDGTRRRLRPGRVGRRALPVGLVLLCRHRAGSELRPRPLSTGRAVLALFKHTVAARTRVEASLAALSQVARDAVVVRSHRGEADAAARQLLLLLDQAALRRRP